MLTARFGFYVIALVTILVALATVPADANEAAAKSIGKQVPNFALRDVEGKGQSLADYADQKIIVLTFLGTECPLARLYADRLGELNQRFAGQGVTFLGIDSNQQDSLVELQNFVRDHQIKFPVLQDNDARVADLVGAARTPQVIVLDHQRVIRYSGRIDDQYGYDRGVGYQRPEVTNQDLANALESLLAGREIETATTPIVGCLIGRPRTPDPNSTVTYSNQISRLFQNHCVECHRPGEIGPFSLLSYDEARGWAEMIQEVVEQDRMPPWGADPRHGSFLNDPTLTPDEKELLATWVKNGCPEGDPSELPPPREFIDGWGIRKPDQIVNMSDKPYAVPAEGTVEYQYFEIDPGWKEDIWIKAAEARPGNRSVVHHIIVFIKEPGATAGIMGNQAVGPNDLLIGYAPGTPPLQGHHGMGRHIKAGSKLIFQLHYTPNGRPAEDISCVGIVFADPKEVSHDIRSGAAMQLKLDIPPGADDYVAHSQRKFRHDELLISLMPHMHLRGKSFRYELEYPDGQREVLLDVPRYDFNWQLVYLLEKPKLIPAGSTLYCEAHYDNSARNLANPNPQERVRWGDQTLEEMMIGWYAAAEARPEDKQKYAKVPSSQSEGGH